VSAGFMKAVVEALARSGHGNLVGCTRDDLEAVKADQSVKDLPATYKDFLLAMGRDADGIFYDLDIHFPGILRIRADAEEMMAESGLQLPGNAFVFMMYQGEQCCYFLVSEGDDPPVFYYEEGEKAPIRAYDHFSDCLVSLLNAYCAIGPTCHLQNSR
jgi:hypothetical protein